MRLAIKPAFIILLLLLLIIPFLFIDSLVNEQRWLLNDATSEISNSFGGSQNILSPVILLTYEAVKKREGQPETRYGYIIPEKVAAAGNIDTDIKKRSIYKVPVYSGTFIFAAEFIIPEPLKEFTVVDTEYLITKESLLGFAVSDIKEVKTFPAFRINDGDIIRGMYPGDRDLTR